MLAIMRTFDFCGSSARQLCDRCLMVCFCECQEAAGHWNCETNPHVHCCRAAEALKEARHVIAECVLTLHGISEVRCPQPP